MLSAEEKIYRVSTILQEHRVTESLENLLNYGCNCDFTGLRLYSEKPPSVIDARKVAEAFRFNFNGKMIDLIVVDLKPSFVDESEYGVLVVNIDGEKVLESSIRKGVGMGDVRHYTPLLFPDGLVSFKNGPWVSELKLLVETGKRNYQQKQDDKRRSAAKKLADNIKLD